jgi:hypothetical protein
MKTLITCSVKTLITCKNYLHFWTKFLSLPLLFILILFLGCDNAGKVKGIVIDGINNLPISDVIVTANAEINIVEEKKYEHSTSISNSKGEFILNRLSPKYSYTIMANKQGYTTIKTDVVPPKEGMTLMLEEPLKIIQVPSNPGVYSYTKSSYNQLTSVVFKTFKGNPYWDRSYQFIEDNNLDGVIETYGKIIFFGAYENNLRILPLYHFKGEVIFPFIQKGLTMTANNVHVVGAYQSDLYVLVYYEMGSEFKRPIGTTVGGFGAIGGSLPTESFESSSSNIRVIDVNSLNSGIYAIQSIKQNKNWLFYKK